MRAHSIDPLAEWAGPDSISTESSLRRLGLDRIGMSHSSSSSRMWDAPVFRPASWTFCSENIVRDCYHKTCYVFSSLSRPNVSYGHCHGLCYRHLGICKTRAFAHHETSATHRFGGHLWPRRIKNASILIKACVNSRPALYVFWARFKTQSFLFILAHVVVSYFCGLLCICQHLCGSLCVCGPYLYIYV